MADIDRVAELRHALANVLGPLLTEVQLTLGSGASFDDETRQSLRDIEALALRMRDILRASQGTAARDIPPTPAPGPQGGVH
jgi:hypothetical protein